MKILKDTRFQFFAFLILFLVINLLQSSYTLLFEDEAYYYVWAKNLAFGYFDHPPMVALWAASGQLVTDGELGIRLLGVVSFPLMLWLIWSMIDIEEKWENVSLFFLLIISIALWQVFGFIMTPDTPLLLFTTLFLLSYKRFLESESILNTLILGFSMSAMLYSKYHGLLVIIFVLISNWKLLLNKKFWWASIFGFILFIPHLNWQYQNDFPSFLYHLKERGKKPYSILNTLTHFANMIAVVGVTFPIIYKAFYQYKVRNTFERSLKNIVYGFFIFFLISTFKSEPQAQWVIIISIPLVLLSYPYFIQKPNARSWLLKLGLIQLGILLIARAFFAFPSISPVQLEPHVSQQWIPDMKKNTEGKPIVFVNSYSNASLYNFYTGIKTHSYSVLAGRKSQYNLLDFEANMQGEEVYSANRYEKDLPILAKRYDSYIRGRIIPDYTTFEKVTCLINEDSLEISVGQNEVVFIFTNTYDKNINFVNTHFYGVFQGHKNKILAKVPLDISPVNEVTAKEQKMFKASFMSPELPENTDVTFRVAIEFYDLLEGFQGNKVAVVKVNHDKKDE